MGLPRRGGRRPVHRRAGRSARGRPGVRAGPGGRLPAYLRDLPVEVLEADGAEGRDAVSLLRRLGLRTLGDLATLPLDAVQDRFGRYGARVWRQARGRGPDGDRAASAAVRPHRRGRVRAAARLRRGRLLQRPHHGGAVGRGPGRAAARGHRRADRGRARRRRGLGPDVAAPAVLLRARPRRPAALAAAGRLGTAVAPRRRLGAGTGERVRFLPEVVEPAAAHADGLWGGTEPSLSSAASPGSRLMLGFDAVTRPVLQGGRGPARRQASVPWGERPTGLRPSDRPWPGRLPGPAPCRVFAEACRPRSATTPGGRWWCPSGVSSSREPTRWRPDGGVAAGGRLGRPVAGQRGVVGRRRAGSPASSWWGSTAAPGWRPADPTTGSSRPAMTDAASRAHDWADDWGADGLEQPQDAVEGARAPAVRSPGRGDAPISRRKHTASTASGLTRSDRRARSCRTPSCTATATSASSTERPRRRRWSGGDPAGAARDRGHRPRRLLRRARGCKAEAATAWPGAAVLTIYGAELSLGLSRPQNGVADPEGTISWCSPGGSRATTGWPARSPRRSCAVTRRDARPTTSTSSPTGPAGNWLVLTGCRKGAVRQALAGAGPRAAAQELRQLTDMFGHDNVVVELTDRGHTRPTPRATTSSPASPPTTACRRSPPATSTTPRPTGTGGRRPRRGPRAAHPERHRRLARPARWRT